MTNDLDTGRRQSDGRGPRLKVTRLAGEGFAFVRQVAIALIVAGSYSLIATASFALFLVVSYVVAWVWLFVDPGRVTGYLYLPIALATGAVAGLVVFIGIYRIVRPRFPSSWFDDESSRPPSLGRSRRDTAAILADVRRLDAALAVDDASATDAAAGPPPRSRSG